MPPYSPNKILPKSLIYEINVELEENRTDEGQTNAMFTILLVYSSST